MQRIRHTKKTRLIYCEGNQDKAFLVYIKSVYTTDGLINIDVKSGTGGDQVHLVKGAIRIGDSYDEVFIQLDSDRDSIEMDEAKQLAHDNNINVLKTTPCTEKILISIVEPKKNTIGWPSSKIKNYLHNNHIPRKKRTNTYAYQALFQKPKLEAARLNNAELDEIIKVFNKNSV